MSGASPTPVHATSTSAASGSLVAMRRAAVFAPTVDGEKTTVTAKLSPGMIVRAPPPLDVPMAVERGTADDTWLLRDGERVVASAVSAKLELEVPGPPAYVQAVWASQHYAGFKEHPFPDCFVCGPHRRRGDGLRIFPGALDSDIVAAPWLPADDLDGGDGKVAVEFHWAALDCPG